MKTVTHWANRFNRPNAGVACGAARYWQITDERRLINCKRCLKVLRSRVKEASK